MCYYKEKDAIPLVLFARKCDGLHFFPVASMPFLLAVFQFIMSLVNKITKEGFMEERLRDLKDVSNKRPAKSNRERQNLTELKQ